MWGRPRPASSRCSDPGSRRGSSTGKLPLNFSLPPSGSPACPHGARGGPSPCLYRDQTPTGGLPTQDPGPKLGPFWKEKVVAGAEIWLQNQPVPEARGNVAPKPAHPCGGWGVKKDLRGWRSPLQTQLVGWGEGKGGAKRDTLPPPGPALSLRTRPAHKMGGEGCPPSPRIAALNRPGGRELGKSRERGSTPRSWGAAPDPEPGWGGGEQKSGSAALKTPQRPEWGG